MQSNDLHDSLITLYRELVFGASPTGTYVLNPSDSGILASIDGLSAADASASSRGGASIAAHVDHVRYGLSLLNRWMGGEENPWADANWAIAWEREAVTDDEWRAIRRAFREEAERWLGALQSPRELEVVALNGVLASIIHLAYHLGAIRQIDPAVRGPKAND